MKHHFTLLSGLIFIAWFTALFTFESCRQDDSPTPNDINTITLHDNLHILDALQAEQTVILDSQTVSITKAIISEELKTGDIIVSSISSTIPDGLFCKITQIQDSSDNYILTTTPAYLEDAIKDGSLSLRMALDTIEIALEDTSGVDLLAGKTNGLSFSIDFEKKLEDVQLSGNVEFTPEFFLYEFNINDGVLESHKHGLTLEVNGLAEVKIENEIGELDIDPIILKTIKFKPILVQLGPLPIILRPYAQLSLDIEGEVETEFGSRIQSSYKGELGIEHKDERSTPYYKTIENNLSGTPLFLKGALEVESSINATLELRPYGLKHLNLNAGIRLMGEGRVELETSPSRGLNCSLDASLQGFAGASFIFGDVEGVIDIFDKNLFEQKGKGCNNLGILNLTNTLQSTPDGLQLKVQVFDDCGPVEGKTVNWEEFTGGWSQGAMLSPMSSVTDAFGIATTSWTWAPNSSHVTHKVKACIDDSITSICTEISSREVTHRFKLLGGFWNTNPTGAAINGSMEFTVDNLYSKTLSFTVSDFPTTTVSYPLYYSKDASLGPQQYMGSFAFTINETSVDQGRISGINLTSRWIVGNGSVDLTPNSSPTDTRIIPNLTSGGFLEYQIPNRRNIPVESIHNNAASFQTDFVLRF